MKLKIISLLTALVVATAGTEIPVYAAVSGGDISTTTLKNNMVSVSETVEEELSSESSVSPSPNAGLKSVRKTAASTPTPKPTATISPKPSGKNKGDEDIVFLTSVDEDGVIDFDTDIVTISENGEYIIKDKNVTGKSIVIDAKDVKLTLENVTIDNSGMSVTTATGGIAPIKVMSGSRLTLNIKGSNTLKGAQYAAGIAVYAVNTSSDYGELIIEGDGSLNVNGGAHGPGIGTNKIGYDNSTGIGGRIEINGGNITATGGSAAAGIGGVFSAVGNCDIEINGGVVRATGGFSAAGIGGAYQQKSNVNVTITGGTVISTGSNGAAGIGTGLYGTTGSPIVVRGGLIDASINVGVTDEIGTELTKITCKLPNEINGKEITIGDIVSTAIADNDGYIYTYMEIPNGTTEEDKYSFGFKCNNKIYYTYLISDNTEPYTLNVYNGADCSCQENTAQLLLNMNESITVNKRTGHKREKLITKFKPSSSCNYPIHNMIPQYEVKLADGGDASAYAEITDSFLEAKYPADDENKVINVKAESTINGHKYSTLKSITIVCDDSERFDLSEGPIIISRSNIDSNMLNVKVGNSAVDINENMEIHIYQSNVISTGITTNTIKIENNINPVVVLENIQLVDRLGGERLIYVGDGSNLTVKLLGDNKFTSLGVSSSPVISGDTSSSVLIVEDYSESPEVGTLTVEATTTSAIGFLKKLVVNSGIVNVTGGADCAGIGGSTNASGIDVEINGGKVNAVGKGSAAGIGGGSGNTMGGNCTITGGRVIATSDSGKGIGGGGNGLQGTITITGGSVNASMKPNPKLDSKTQYLVTLSLEDITGEKDVTYTIGSDTREIPSSTDTEGNLYLYLTEGKQWIKVFADGKTYYKYINIKNNNLNSGTAITNPTAGLNVFEIPGQSGDTNYDHENHTITIDVPSNIDLSTVVPIVDFSGCECEPALGRPMNFNNSTKSAVFSIIGDDMQDHNYTVTLNPTAPEISTFDVEKGSVNITDAYISYGGTRYGTSTEGYVIQGTTTENSIAIDCVADSPDITLKNLNISCLSESVNPISIAIGININLKIEGSCNISSQNTAVMALDRYDYDADLRVNITGKDAFLNLNGNSHANTVNILGDNITLEIVGETASEQGPVTTITSGDGRSALGGEGKFITDSITNIHIIDNAPSEVAVKNSNGDLLYQMTMAIELGDNADLTKTECTYNGQTYYVAAGEDKKFYLMLPNDSSGEETVEHTVQFDGENYIGSGKIDNAPVEVNLQTVKVKNLLYTVPVPMPYTGGKVTFEAEGNLVADNVSVLLIPDISTYPTLEQTITAVNNKNIAEIQIPLNPNDENRVTYTVYTVIKGNYDNKKAWETKILLDKNTSVCRIEDFYIENQIEKRIVDTDTMHVISVDMPYDHEWNWSEQSSGYFYAPTITFKGASINPKSKQMTKYNMSSSGDHLFAYYRLTASDSSVSKQYTINLYKKTMPEIRSIRFSGGDLVSSSSLSSDGGTVRVTASGTNFANMEQAEKASNRMLYFEYVLNGETVTLASNYDSVNGVFYSDITLPPNNGSDRDDIYEIKARVGEFAQTETTANLIVRRQKSNNTVITGFEVEGQVGQSEITDDKIINVLMPYDADLTNLSEITITTKDPNASCAVYPQVSQPDFTSDVTYRVTAENGETDDYIIRITTEPTPTITNIEFANPQWSSAGRVFVTLTGTNLDNLSRALTPSNREIVVSGILINGNSENSFITSGVAELNQDGRYSAVINVPANNHDEERTYQILAKIGNTVGITKQLTVPKQEENAKELTDIIISENQSELTVIDNRIYLYVPYNTDLRNIEPQIFYTGLECSPTGSKNFNEPVMYTVRAQDNSYNVYEVHVLRSGSAGIDTISFDQPESGLDTNVKVDIKGKFIPEIDTGVEKDVMKVLAVPRNGGETEEGIVKYDTSVYGGHATAELNLPQNSLATEQIYDIKIFINDIEQPIGFSGVIIVPGARSSAIREFSVNLQRKSVINNDDTIDFYMPYNTDLTNIAPIITIDGDSISPQSGEVVNFDNEGHSVEYTVYSAGHTSRVYTVRAHRDGLPSVRSTEFSNEPVTYKGTKVEAKVSGVFFYSMSIKAVPIDENGNVIDGAQAIDGNVTMTEWHEASAEIDIPDNDSTTEDKQYRIDIYLDGFDSPIEYTNQKIITVPRRKTRAITGFKVNNQVGIENIGENDIIVKVAYDADITNIIPSISFDGDSIYPENNKTISFDNSTQSQVYTVSANDDTDRLYTVYVLRDGDPTISHVAKGKIVDFRGGGVNIVVEGVFFESLKVRAVPVGGGAGITSEISFKSPNFVPGNSTVMLTLPENDTYTDKSYSLEFELDGQIVPYTGNKIITVPRRTARKITEFTMPDIQEGDTRMDGTNIYIDVPYNVDITSVMPEITYDADSITPEEAQDFSDLDNPVKYTLSSSGDEDVTYTVYITKLGSDPYLKGMTADKQTGETVYDGDNVSLVLKSGANLKAVEPILDFNGEDYSPKGAWDFTNSNKEPVVYTITNKYGIEHKYYVTITKKKSGGGGSFVAPTPTPTVEPTAEPTAEPTQTPEPTAKTKPYIHGYVDGDTTLFRPDANITRAEIATIISILDESFDEFHQYAASFSDVNPDMWYANYINFAVSKGCISGYDDGTCRPENMITRAEFASLIARYIGIDAPASDNLFMDIDGFWWCRNEINALARAGILNGYDNNEFKPEKFVTRAETVTIINRIFERKMTDEIASKLTCPFTDITSEHWAYNDALLASCEY